MNVSRNRNDVAGTDVGAGVVELWRERDGLWRWLFRPSGNHVELKSKQGYTTRDLARTAAQTAYPGVPILESSDGASDSGGRRRLGRLLPALLVLGFAFAAIAGLVVLVLAVVAARVRRSAASFRRR